MKTIIVLLSQMLFLRMLFYESLQSTEKWVSLKSATSMIAESIEKHCMNQKRKLTIGAIMTQHKTKQRWAASCICLDSWCKAENWVRQKRKGGKVGFCLPCLWIFQDKYRHLIQSVKVIFDKWPAITQWITGANQYHSGIWKWSLGNNPDV